MSRLNSIMLVLIIVVATAAVTGISCAQAEVEVDIYVNTSGWWYGGEVFNVSSTPIQDAVNAACEGETIFVRRGNYSENIDISTQNLTLTGRAASVVVVSANQSDDHVFEVTANHTTLSGFTVTGATGSGMAGICLTGADYCNISDNNASNNNCGIGLKSSSSNSITHNSVQNNTRQGFYLANGSAWNVITFNNIVANGVPQPDGSYQWQFVNNQSESVVAIYNYWGTENKTIIDASIEDKGMGWFYPIEGEPVPCDPIPELPTVALFVVGLLGVAGYTRIGRK